MVTLSILLILMLSLPVSPQLGQSQDGQCFDHFLRRINYLSFESAKELCVYKPSVPLTIDGKKYSEDCLENQYCFACCINGKCRKYSECLPQYEETRTKALIFALILVPFGLLAVASIIIFQKTLEKQRKMIKKQEKERKKMRLQAQQSVTGNSQIDSMVIEKTKSSQSKVKQ